MMDASASRRRRPRGFSLIELLVSMVIALVVTLAITTVMIQGEGSKRSTSSVNEINQTGAYVAYVLDRQLRNAGSGFAQRWGDAFGCAVTASRTGSGEPGLMLPRASAFPAPFANATQTPRLAPVLIVADGANSGTDVRGDLLTIMAGSAGFGEMAQLVNTNSVSGTGSSGSLQLPNTVGYSVGDLVLLADSSVAGGCLVEQVSGAPGGGLLQLSGTYYQQSGNGVSIGSFGATTFAIQLGGASTNPPQFTIFGVGDQRTLYSYDLLRTGGSDAPVALADGVVEMRALYGIDTSATPDGKVDDWVQPTATNGYDAATLMSGTTAARDKLRRIVAVRLGLILRTSLKEKQAVATSQTLTLFGDLAAKRTRTLSSTDEAFYRFRTIEITVPLRNVLLAPEAAS